MSIRTTKLKVIKFAKDFLLASRILQILQPFNRLFAFLNDFNLLTSWVHKHKKDPVLMNDFYRPVRSYDDRLKSFSAIADHYKLTELPVCYLEFGVASADSFKWWLKTCNNPVSGVAGRLGAFFEGRYDCGCAAAKRQQGLFHQGHIPGHTLRFSTETGALF